MPGTILSYLHIQVYLISIITIWERDFNCSHITEEEIEAQKIKKTWLRSQTLVDIEIEVQFQMVWLCGLYFNSYMILSG